VLVVGTPKNRVEATVLSVRLFREQRGHGTYLASYASQDKNAGRNARIRVPDAGFVLCVVFGACLALVLIPSLTFVGYCQSNCPTEKEIGPSYCF
jgi:hypothetical protein